MAAPLLYIVTGGNGGIGYETALALAKAPGSRVIIGARNKERLDAAVASIKEASGNADIHGFLLDLGTLSSVHSFAKDVAGNKGIHIQALVLNAGIITPSFEWSTDGVEATWATNHLGHFYLVKLLRPLLAPNARVVATSSGTHDPKVKAGLPEPQWSHPSDLAMLKSQLDGKPPIRYNGMNTYTNSKLCNIYFVYHLAQELQQQGSAVTAVAYDPGYIPHVPEQGYAWLAGGYHGAACPSDYVAQGFTSEAQHYTPFRRLPSSPGL